MASKPSRPALIIHGGAGALGPARERPQRRRGMLAAAERGAEILRQGGSALDAAMAAVVTLEDAPLFNAGYGSTLNADGKVEMDASVMIFPPSMAIDRAGPAAGASPRLGIGAVAAVSRVRNPIMLARAVMEFTPHVLMVGAGAERIAARARLKRCRPEQLISPRAREGWLARKRTAQREHGTVGAVALDARGAIAAATSTGGIGGKLPGRVGDSAIVGAGTYADHRGGASATGLGEAIIKTMLCLEAVRALDHADPSHATRAAIARLRKIDDAEGGIIMLDRQGRFGYANNAEHMEVALFDPIGGVRGLRLNAAGEAIE
ncbi:MAG TPA: isoaspartyl peptidase/L-asparaginase family protein [Candidatus Binataceae bacterium]|nr:isoaspartyl peptidase/L-asparaginase family protein [Candidatus Binataceae bacterium]